MIEDVFCTKSLNNFSFESSTVSKDMNLNNIRNLEKLKELNFRRTKIDDKNLAFISELKDLEWLYLEHTAISSTGIKSLKKLKKLESIFLTDTKIDDDCIDVLVGMKTLKYLEMLKTGVSCSSVKKLKEQRPDIEVIHPCHELDE